MEPGGCSGAGYFAEECTTSQLACESLLLALHTCLAAMLCRLSHPRCSPPTRWDNRLQSGYLAQSLSPQLSCHRPHTKENAGCESSGGHRMPHGTWVICAADLLFIKPPTGSKQCLCTSSPKNELPGCSSVHALHHAEEKNYSNNSKNTHQKKAEMAFGGSRGIAAKRARGRGAGITSPQDKHRK